jgi:hypothetical protein
MQCGLQSRRLTFRSIQGNETASEQLIASILARTNTVRMSETERKYPTGSTAQFPGKYKLRRLN